MKHTQIIRNPGAAIVAVAVILLTFGESRADTVKLKDGKTLEGLITFEAADMLKIKVQKSSTISETVTVLKSNVEEIIKSAPDDVDFAKLQNLLPTPSLVTTSGYRSIIEKGPQAFLNSYPDSKHRPDVEKIKVELEDELARVDSGFIKLEGEWISPKSQQAFKELIAARILKLGLQQKAQAGNFIGALRDFEAMEETYFGTPSYVDSVGIMLQLLPGFGQRLQRMVTEVDYMNEQFKQNLAKMTEEKAKVVMAAREQEEEALKKKFQADKDAGIRWYAPNQRDKSDLTAYIAMVASEIDRLKTLDLAALQENASQLVKIDELLAEDKLLEAKELMKEVGGGGGSSSKGRSSSSKSPYGNFGKGGSRSGSRGTKAKTSYVLALREKINQRDQAIAAAKEQAADSAAGAEATQVIRSEDVVAAAAPAADPGSETGEPPASGTGGTGALTDLIASTEVPKKADPKASGKSKTSLKPKKPSSKKKPAGDDGEEEERERRPVADGGFKWSFQKIAIGFAVLMALVVGLMKILGIGGAKT